MITGEVKEQIKEMYLVDDFSIIQIANHLGLSKLEVADCVRGIIGEIDPYYC